MLKLFVHKGNVPVHYTTFPAGESLIRIEGSRTPTSVQDVLNVNIALKFRGNGDLIDLMLLVDAVRRHYAMFKLDLSLNMPYLPYARQDRVCSSGESLSVKVVADIINSLNFNRVYCNDIHSDVGAALINNLIHITQDNTAYKLPHNLPPHKTILVSPDAGASKKVFEFAKMYGYGDIVRADKVRNPLTGEIIETKVYSEHVGDKDFLILDDCIDGGRTFIELAKVLRTLTTGKINLYCTHGIFSKGIDCLHPLIDRVYCANIMLDNWEEKDTYGIVVAV